MGFGLNLKNQKETKNENHISVNSDSISAQMLEMLTQINFAIGGLKSSVEIISKQIEKLSEVDEIIRETQQDFNVRLRTLEYDVSKIIKKLKMEG